MATVVDVRVNPNDMTQRVELWGNGRIDVYNAPPINDGPTEWYNRLDLPVAVAIHIVNWATMAGYVLDKQGGVRRFNGAPDVATSKPEGYDGPNIIVPGIPYWPTGIYVDWSWSPFQAGFGVALDGYGTLHNFGGAVRAPRFTNRWSSSTVARKLLMEWGTLKAYTLDYSGGIHADYNAKAAPPVPTWPSQDMARDFAIVDWENPRGYTMDKFGRVHNWGGAGPAIGYPNNTAGDWARRLILLRVVNPTRLQVVGAWSQQYVWNASTPPSVTAGGFNGSPAAEVTDTTRPVLSWTYSDQQLDQQAEARVLVFRQAYVNANLMTNPLLHVSQAVVDVSTIDPDTRGIASPVDLANGSYRMYVRVKDTAEQYSPWATRPWTQNVPVPATPTTMTAVADQADMNVELSVKPPVGGVATLVRFEYSDNGGLSWLSVRGAHAVPLIATTLATDLDAPLGPVRMYRAVAYSIDPRTASLPSNTASASLSEREHVLTAVNDASMGGVIRVIESPDWVRPVTVGVFEGLGSEYPIVISDGAPKARRLKLTIEANGRPEWEKLDRILRSGSVLVHRDPFGDVAYCRLVSDFSRKQRMVAPLPGEDTPWRHNHVVDVELVEVRPPVQAV